MSEIVLNVSKSVMNTKWVFQDTDDGQVSRLMQAHGLPEMIARMLVARNVDENSVEAFLRPRLGEHFPDPFSLKDMKPFCEWLADSLEAGKKVGVFGDFDVDGSSSTAIFVKFFRHIGYEVPFYIPDRLTEGYGPSINAMQSLKEQGANIVLIADCGTTSFDVIEQGRAIGLDIVVFDHHETEDELPDTNFLINPKRKDDDSGLDMLCAAAVCFLACVGLNTVLRDRGFYKEKGIEQAPLKNWLDIIALATICDMVPLLGANRLFVRYGFQQMAQTENIGLQALLSVCGIKGDPSVMHAGFALGPRINAGSRIHDASLGAKLLSATDMETASTIAWTLNDCNDKRKEIQSSMMQEAIGQITAVDGDKDSLIFAANEGWHAGLSGLVAGQIKERFGKPAVIVTFAENEKGELEGRGSGRSVPGINMAAAFIDARNEGLVLKGGGHAMAGGFTVLPEKIDELKTYLSSHVEKQLNGQEIVPEQLVDTLASVSAVKTEFVKIIDENGGPYGQGNPEPLFVVPSARIQMVKIVGKDHVSCRISDVEGGASIKAIAFRATGTPLGKLLLDQSRDITVHLLGHFKINEWQGRESVDFIIKDAAFANEAHKNQQEKKLFA